MSNNNGLTNIKQHLNKTGAFLEQKIHVALDRYTNPRFISRREHPYSVVNLINGRIPEVFEGTIDVFAVAKVSDDTSLCLCIECKKADPKQKHWVFELRTTGNELYPFVYYDAKQDALNYEKNIFFPSLGYGGMKFFDKAIQAFQFKDLSGDLSREMQEMAHHSLKQANQAIKAFAAAPKEVFRLLNSDPVNILYLPIVITTANLWATKYNPQHVDWNTGELAEDKLKLESRDWVHYEFPLPVNLKLKGRGDLEFEKRPTFVVKADKFPDFIDKLIQDAANYILDLN